MNNSYKKKLISKYPLFLLHCRLIISIVKIMTENILKILDFILTICVTVWLIKLCIYAERL